MCALSFVYILVNKRSLVFLFFLSNLFFFRAPGEILGVPGQKNVLDALENDTKGNFQENILGKI